MSDSPFAAACVAQWGTTGRLKLHEPLARHGTFAVGGPAEVWLSATSEEDLLGMVALAHEHAELLLFVGNGTNVLFADAGARGAVVRLSLDGWSLRQEESGSARLVAGAGVSLPKLVNDLAAQGWSGLEWGAGVPGTIGGAVVSNAGCHGCCIGDNLVAVRLLDARDPARAAICDVPAAALDLSYRHSRLRSGRRVVFSDDGLPHPVPRAQIDPVEVVTGATILLRRDDPAAIKARVAHYKQHRKETQPPQPSAGSVFKNPPGDYAGRLVEAAGLKGHQIGRAAISSKHANFIVNLGGASVADIVALITLAHAEVLRRFDIDLELEVEPRGDW